MSENNTPNDEEVQDQQLEEVAGGAGSAANSALGRAAGRAIKRS